MTVRGVGMDIVDVAGFASQVAESGTVFEELVFTDHEIAEADKLRGSRRDQFLASRFAVKEALVKAWFAALPGGAPMLPEPMVLTSPSPARRVKTRPNWIDPNR